MTQTKDKYDVDVLHMPHITFFLFIFSTMKDKETINDYLHNRLQTEINNTRLTFTSCTMATFRWLRRYAHCYSIACSFFCVPFWIIIFPIALAFDICILTIASIIFIVTFLVYCLIAPWALTCRFSSCLASWNPINICRYAFIEALRWFQTIIAMFDLIWLLYCGSGETANGIPICCIYCCGEECHKICSEATHIDIAGQPCTIL